MIDGQGRVLTWGERLRPMRLDGIVGVVVRTRHHARGALLIPDGDPVFDRLRHPELERFYAAALARDALIEDLRHRQSLARVNRRATMRGRRGTREGKRGGRTHPASDGAQL